MSRIGKKPVPVPAGVEISIDGQTVSWTAYLRSLEDTVEWCNAQLRGLEPAEVESRACT